MATQASREALAADLGRSQLALQEAYREAERLNAEVSRLAGLSAMHRHQRDDLLAALEALFTVVGETLIDYGSVEGEQIRAETHDVMEQARAAIDRAKSNG